MADLRTILLANYKNGLADQIKTRWCSGDSPGLFKERWEKLFEDWVGVKQEKFDPSRVSRQTWSDLSIERDGADGSFLRSTVGV